MKIELNKQDLNRLNKILEAKQMNIAFADMLMSFYDYDLSKFNIETKEDYKSLFMQAMELDEESEENIEVCERYIGKNFQKINDHIFTSNPYFKTVRPKLIKIGDYSLCLDHFYKNQSFAYDDVEIDSNDYAELSKIGYFDHKVSFLALSYKNEIWMNISPNEINTMTRSINEAAGDVLVLGLGLGYYPFMISLKPNVKSITVIEKDSTIIDIFKKNIFPFFPHKEKIKIIKDDGFKFIENSSRKFDYTFIDLWHNPNDGLPMYLKFKKLEKSNTKYSYWLEKSILAMYRRCKLILIEEALDGAKDDNYLKAENEIDEVINKLYFETKDLVIDSYDKLIEFIK